MLGIKKSHTTPYHPQCDGLLEWLNRMILGCLPPWCKIMGMNGKATWQKNVLHTTPVHMDLHPSIKCVADKLRYP